MAPIVFVLMPDQDMRTPAERRPFDVLAADRPIEHVTKQLMTPEQIDEAETRAAEWVEIFRLLPRD